MSPGARSTPPRSHRHRRLPTSLALGVTGGLLILAFMLLGSEVGEGDTRSFDVQLLHAAQSLRAGHPAVVEVLRDLSSLGSTTVLTLFTLTAVAYLISVRSRASAALLATSVIAGALAVGALKVAFARLRPDAAFADMVVAGMSFPSGHAGMSAIVYLTLGSLIASTRSRVSERGVVLVTAALMALLVGLSRIALGVHWATDVLGGWAFGAGWALAWLLLDRQVRDRAAARLR